jgi:hypothetical protein
VSIRTEETYLYFETRLAADYLKANWFIAAFFAVLSANAAVLYFDGLHSVRLKEFGLLFDFAILLPALYLLCYRSQGKKAVFRALALACLGVWAFFFLLSCEQL